MATLPSTLDPLTKLEYTCPVRDHTTKKKSHAIKHILCHSEETYFKCTVCSYISKHRGSVRVHEKRHHPRKSSETSSKPSSLNNNIEGPPELGVIAEQVGSITSETSSFRKSQRIRTLFTCTKCYYITTRHHLLVSHRKAHYEERPFPCTFLGCSFRSRRFDNARGHERQIHKSTV